MISQNRPFKRSDRVGDKVRLSVSEILLKNIVISDTGLITITRVEMSRDLRYAKIFFSHIDTELPTERLEKKLNQSKNKIRYHLGSSLGTKHVPYIEFKFDKRYEKANRIDTLISKVKNK